MGQIFTRKYPSAVKVARAAPVVDNYPQCGQGGVRWTAPSKRHPLAREMRVPEETMNFAQRIRTNALLVLYNYWKELRGSRSEEHTSELQSLMRISYAVFCLKKKTNKQPSTLTTITHETAPYYTTFATADLAKI